MKNFYLHGIKLLICLSIGVNFSFAQNCGPLTLDSIANPGIYTVATLTESDGLRNGPDYAGATVYYPTNATPPFASIVIVPGYLSAQSSVQDWGPFLASHGIVTMTIGTNSGFDNPPARKDALLDAIFSLRQENTRGNSPLNGQLDTIRVAVGGWSMGGGGAQLAAAADTSLKAVIALCPWLGNGQATTSGLNHPVPLLIFSGEFDGVAPPALHANIHYNRTPQTTNKLIYEVDNGGHQVANNPTGGGGYVGKIALSWLKYHLVGDSCYCPLLHDTPSTASDYVTNVVCPAITTSIQVEPDFSYELYPNPASASINIKLNNIDRRAHYEIISLTGARVSSGELLEEKKSIDIHDLPAGVYVIHIQTALFSERMKFVVK